MAAPGIKNLAINHYISYANSSLTHLTTIFSSIPGTDSSATGTGRTTALHVVQTSSGQLSGLTPVVVSRYDPDAAGHMIGPFTTSAAATGSSQSTQLGKVGALVSRN